MEVGISYKQILQNYIANISVHNIITTIPTNKILAYTMPETHCYYISLDYKYTYVLCCSIIIIVYVYQLDTGGCTQKTESVRGAIT